MEKSPLDNKINKITCGNQNEKQFSKIEEICSCIAQKRKVRYISFLLFYNLFIFLIKLNFNNLQQDLCTIQVQYIFQNRMGKIVCETCATPESIRVCKLLLIQLKYINKKLISVNFYRYLKN